MIIIIYHIFKKKQCFCKYIIRSSEKTKAKSKGLIAYEETKDILDLDITFYIHSSN